MLRSLSVAALAFTLSGCVAAVIPLVAAGMITTKQVAKREPSQPTVTLTPPIVQIAKPVAVETPLAPVVADVPIPVAAVPSPDMPPFIRFALDQAALRGAGEAVASKLLVKDVDINKPRFTPCDDRPLAVMIDLDTLGSSEIGIAGGIVAHLPALRVADIGIIWLSGQPESARAALTEQLKSVDPDGKDTLMLSRGRGDRKQMQRFDGAAGRCIIAMAGDAKSDFDELFDYLRSADDAIALEPLWEKGWFIAAADPLIRKEANALDPR